MLHPLTRRYVLERKLKVHRNILGLVYFLVGGLMAFIMVATPLRNLDSLSSETLLVFLGNMLVGFVFLLSSFGGFSC